MSRNSTQSDILIQQKFAELQKSNPHMIDSLIPSASMPDMMNFTIKDIMHLPEQQRMEIIQWVCRPTRKTSLDDKAINNPANSPVNDLSKVSWHSGVSVLSRNGQPIAPSLDNCSETMMSYSQSNFGGLDLQSTLLQNQLDIANTKARKNPEDHSPMGDPRVGQSHLPIRSCGTPPIINFHSLELLGSVDSVTQGQTSGHLRQSSDPIRFEEFSPNLNGMRPQSSPDLKEQYVPYITANRVSPGFGDYVITGDVITEEDDVDLISLPTERKNSDVDSSE